MIGEAGLSSSPGRVGHCVGNGKGGAAESCPGHAVPDVQALMTPNAVMVPRAGPVAWEA